MSEPQSVTELMACTRTLWERQLEACDDDSRETRRDLHEQLAALGDEYPGADYPRREDIEKAFRDLMARHRQLPVLDVPEPAPEAPSAPLAADDAAGNHTGDTSAEATLANPSPSFSGADSGDVGPTPSRGGAGGGAGRWVSGWYRWAYSEVDYQVLCRNREKRLAELGGRLHDLQVAGRMDDVTTDEGVARMIAQVEQVDAAITDNRAAKDADN